MIQDSKPRSLVKGISWRIIGTIDTFVIAYFFFHKTSIALPIAITEVFTKILLYFFHERLWNKIRFLRENDKLSNIRSLLKGVSWRFFGSVDTILISFLFSGNPLSSLKVGLSEVVTKVLLFYLHERAWRKFIKWGRIRQTAPVKVEAS
ncbi:MAG: DUF2061 domain-containing protein [Bacteroidota bacterium]